MALDTRGLASGFGQGFGLADQYYARQDQQDRQGKADDRADRNMEMREEQFGMQKDQAEQQKARQSAEFTLGKIAQGVDLSDDEMKFMKENPQYWGALDPEMDAAIENAQRVIDPSDPMDSNDPEALYSMNLMFGHRINRGEGGKKRIAGLYPGQQEGTVAFDLEVEGEDGKKYNAPMTKNRGVKDDDEIMQTPVESLINQVQGYRMLRNAFRGPEAQQNASRVLAALRGDGGGAPTKGINMNGFLVDPVTGEQMGDFRTADQRSGPKSDKDERYGEAFEHPQLGWVQPGPNGQLKQMDTAGGRGGSGNAPADVQTAEWMVASGIANDLDEAYTRVKESRSDPARFVSNYMDRAIKAQESAGLVPGYEGYRSSEQLRDEALKTLQVIRENTRGTGQPEPDPKEPPPPRVLDIRGLDPSLPRDGSAAQQEDGSYTGVINRNPQQLPANVTPAPTEAINYLKQNPGMAAEFRAKYNYLPEGF